MSFWALGSSSGDLPGGPSSGLVACTPAQPGWPAQAAHQEAMKPIINRGGTLTALAP
jgi:hypothetical protein